MELVETANTENYKFVNDDDELDDLHYFTVSSRADDQQNINLKQCAMNLIIQTFSR